MNIVFLGAGQVATTLAPQLARVGHKIVEVFSRTALSCDKLGMRLQELGQTPKLTTDLSDIRRDADMYIYALPDDVIGGVNRLISTNDEAIHLLVAGTVDMTVFTGRRHKGVMYPFQSFSRVSETDLSHVPILIEASDETTLMQIKEVACSLSDQVFETTIQDRERLHLAGVLANNFSNHLFAMAKKQLEYTGLPFSVLLPLIDETARKVHIMSPKEAQTGPAVRHDSQTILTNMSLLDDEREKTIYRLITEDIQSGK